jgi:hypothetical protein
MAALRRTPARAAAALWALRAARAARRQLRGRPLADVGLPTPPAVASGARRSVEYALVIARATCLEASLVRQAWLRAHGEQRDLIVGVSRAGEPFGAHAWLEGEEGGGHAELHRLPARP